MPQKMFPALLAFSLLTLTPLAIAQPSGNAPSPKPRSLGSLSFEPCSLTAIGVADSVEAQCTTIDVLENPDDPGSRTISLALGWVPASGEAEPDPLFMIAGGPGQSAKESYATLHRAFRDVRRTRNVLLLDARGTGGSQPLVCRNQEGNAAITDGDASDLTLANNLDAAREFARRCAQTLGADSDLRFYGTAEHVHDLETVRKAIAAETINLIGISYGTRVAQQYAATYPQATRSVVLDSVVPNSLALGNEHSVNLESALSAQFERCREIPACTENLGDPRQQLDYVGKMLRAGDLPPTRFRDAISGEWREETPTFGHLSVLLRLYAYSPEGASTLPFLLSEAAQGRYEALMAQANSLASSLTEQIYHGMQLSVMCTEDGDELVAREADEGKVLGTEFIEFAKAQCSVWPRGTRDPSFRQPLTGDLPVLLLSGEFDPVTPSRYGDEVVASLPNGRHLVLPGQGHSVVGAGCMPKLFAQFLENADADNLDTDCLKRLKPLPPFAGAYGWEP